MVRDRRATPGARISTALQDAKESGEAEHLCLSSGQQHSSRAVIPLTNTDSAGVCVCVCIVLCTGEGIKKEAVSLEPRLNRAGKYGSKAIFDAAR